MAQTQLDLYIEQAKDNERSQSSTFDLTAFEVEKQLRSKAVEEPVDVVEGSNNNPSTGTGVVSVIDEAYTELDKVVEEGKKKFKNIVTTYNDSNNTLICFMLLIIIILMFLNLVLN